MVALACGDSYGNAFEMEGLMGKRFNRDTLPDTPLKPAITDDTKMALILLQHYKKYGDLNEDLLLRDYRFWAKEDGLADGIGIHTHAVLLQGKADKDSQGNGALMRNIPFGVQLIDDGYSFEEAVIFMNRDSILTHANETIFLANEIALDLALHGVKILNKEHYKPIIKKLHHGYSAWVIHSLYIVIEALKLKLSFLDGFKSIVSQGGDTDTNCAIYGAIKEYKEDFQKY